MDASRTLDCSIEVYLAELTAALRDLDRPIVEHIAWVLVEAHAAGRTVFICGNGGSAAVATHWAADLSKLTALPDLPRLKVMALTDSVATITAAANDLDYSEIFVDQLRTFMTPGDVVIGITTSGRSPNVLKALDYANDNAGVTIAITGLGGAALRDVATTALIVTSTSVQRVEDVAGVAAHLACLLARGRIIAEHAETARTA